MVRLPDPLGDESCLRIKTAQKHLTRKLISALARQGGDMGELGFLLDGEVNIHTLRVESPMPDVNGLLPGVFPLI
jgi:hypothetical protein